MCIVHAIGKGSCIDGATKSFWHRIQEGCGESTSAAKGACSREGAQQRRSENKQALAARGQGCSLPEPARAAQAVAGETKRCHSRSTSGQSGGAALAALAYDSPNMNRTRCSTLSWEGS